MQREISGLKATEDKIPSAVDCSCPNWTYSDSAANIKFRTKTKQHPKLWNHAFYPTDNKRGCLGFLNQMWKDLWVKYIYLGESGRLPPL
jgi:hypothetical protein